MLSDIKPRKRLPNYPKPNIPIQMITKVNTEAVITNVPYKIINLRDAILTDSFLIFLAVTAFRLPSKSDNNSLALTLHIMSFDTFLMVFLSDLQSLIDGSPTMIFSVISPTTSELISENTDSRTVSRIILNHFRLTN